jgi:two-component system cell cycle sensor histidine kinase/response regulator CckA
VKSGEAFSVDELEHALAGAEVGVWSWDIASGKVRWSAQTERIFGLAEGAFDGTLVAYEALVHPEDRAHVSESIQRAVERGETSFRMSHRVLHPDGAIKWAEARGAVVRDAAGAVVGMLGTVVDSTEAKRSEEQIKKNEELYRLLTELSSDWVYRADLSQPSMVPEIVVGSFERTTGYLPQEIEAVGGWMAVVHPDDHRNFEALLPELMSGHPTVNEYRIRDKEGEIRWLRDRARPILDPKTHQLIGLYGGVQDITEQRKLEEQLLHAQKMDALALLAGSVAHDFNNLLLVMGLTLEAITVRARRGNVPEPGDVADAQSAVRRATELTQSLLAFARQQPAQEQAVDLGKLVEGALPILTRAVTNVRISLRLPRQPVLASADPARLELVVLNLVLNARDAQPDGGEVRIEVGAEDLAADAAGRPPELPIGRYATLRVSDDGAGMDAATMRRIFEPFFTTKPPGMGTGLGLATAHGLLRQMGGAISVVSTVGAGSTFTLHLPLAGSAIAERHEATSMTSVGGTESLLVVEDEPAVRRLISRTLVDRGYSVVTLESAEVAMALSDAELARFQLVLSDYRLTGADGLTLLATIKERAPTIKRILMSGYFAADSETLTRSTDAFLGKPFTPDGLARKVRETLDR